MKVEIDWDIFRQIRDIRFFIIIFKDKYKEQKRKLKHDLSKFRLIRFTVIYVIIDLILGIGGGLLLFSNDKEVVLFAIFLLVALLFIPYILFLAIFLIIYLIQIMVLTLKSAVKTLNLIYRKR